MVKTQGHSRLASYASRILACLFLAIVAVECSPVHGDSISGSAAQRWSWGGFRRTRAPSPAPSLPSVTKPTLLPTCSLSGFVYHDVNSNGQIDGADWAIENARIALTRTGSNDPPIIVATKKDGSYLISFTPPSPASIYSVQLLTPGSQPGNDQLGLLVNSSSQSVASGKLDLANRRFYDITMSNGYHGKSYNFAELAFPIMLATKRIYINGDPTAQHMPEPASIVTLLSGLATVVGLGFRHRFGRR